MVCWFCGVSWNVTGRVLGGRHWPCSFLLPVALTPRTRRRRYDSHAIATRLRQLREAHHAGDRDTAMMLVRENLDRGLAGLGNPLLYTHCTTGTKNLIEEYVAEMVLQLERLAAAPGDVADLIPIERSLADGRQAYGRTALLLSGGLSFGMCHWGVAKCLFEQQLLPPIISGASIGALVAALLGEMKSRGVRRSRGLTWLPDRCHPDDTSRPTARTADRGTHR